MIQCRMEVDMSFEDIEVGDFVYKTAVVSTGFWDRNNKLFGIKMEVTKVLKNHFFCGKDKFTKKTGTCCGKDYTVRKNGEDQTEEFLKFRKKMNCSNVIKKLCDDIKESSLYKLEQEDLTKLLNIMEDSVGKL